MFRSIVAGLVGFALVIGLGSPVFAQDSLVRVIPARSLYANPVSLPDAVEFHIVAGYEAELVADQGIVAIEVDRPGAVVALVLTSYEPVRWTLDVAPGSTVVAVFVGSHVGQPSVEAALDMPVRLLDLPVSSRPNDAGFGELLRTLQSEFQMDRVASGRTEYWIPDRVIISGVEEDNPRLDADWPQPTGGDQTIRFSLLLQDGQLQEWTLTGPIDGRYEGAMPPDLVVRSPDGTRLYQFADHAMIVRDLEADEVRSVPLPPRMESISWPEGIAYDTRRDEIALVTTGGGSREGFLYRFDAEAEQWIDARSMGSDDRAFTLAYDPVDDLYVGIGLRRGLTLVAIPAGGGGNMRVMLEPELVGIERVLGVDLYREAIRRLIWLLPTEHGYVFLGRSGSLSSRGGRDERSDRAIWWMPRGSSTAELTYRPEPEVR